MSIYTIPQSISRNVQEEMQRDKGFLKKLYVPEQRGSAHPFMTIRRSEIAMSCQQERIFQQYCSGNGFSRSWWQWSTGAGLEPVQKVGQSEQHQEQITHSHCLEKPVQRLDLLWLSQP